MRWQLLIEPGPSWRRARALERAAARTLDEAEVESLVDWLAGHPDQLVALPVLLQRARREQVSRLFQLWLDSGHIPEGGLALAGRCGLEEALPLAVRQLEQGDWHQQTEAVLCLLGLPLAPDIAQNLRTRLDSMEGRPLFEELLPALAGPLEWPEARRRLMAWAPKASVDCLGGIVLGLGVLGARSEFEQLLEDDRYELYGGGTGLESFAYRSARCLGLDIPWLAERVASQPHNLALWQSLLAWWRVNLHWGGDELRNCPPPCSATAIDEAVCALEDLCPADLQQDFSGLWSQLEQAMTVIAAAEG